MPEALKTFLAVPAQAPGAAGAYAPERWMFGAVSDNRAPSS